MKVLFFSICFSFPASAQSKAFVQGQVVDEAQRPMAFVNVQIVDTTDGATTGRDGRFAFSTRRLGRHDLSATFIGFEPARRTLHLTAGDTTMVRLVLRRAFIELGETVVTASTYTTGEEETVTLSPLDVVTTPGASADIFRAFKTFPGVATVDDGAGLFVRGGDVSETVVLLDQATVVHPYRYESPTGGVFGTIPPFMVQGTAFSTGGFSARYGNALSAVLAMESLDLTPRDLTGKIRTDWERLLGAFGILRLGTEVEHADNRFVGSIPQGDILDPEAEVFELDASYSARRTGAPTATSCWTTPI